MPQAEYEKGEGDGEGPISYEKHSQPSTKMFFFFSKLFFVFVVNLSSLIGALFLLIQAINKRSLWHATYITDILAFDLLFIIRTRKRKVERIRENHAFASHRTSNSDRFVSDRFGSYRLERGLPVKLVSIFNILYLFLFLFLFLLLLLFFSFVLVVVRFFSISTRCF